MITIIGNGESRKDINIDKINGVKVGCNAIYLYNKVDMVCAMDKFWREKICKETKTPLLSRKVNNAFQTTLQIYNGKWENTTCPARGYCSGTTAIDYMAHISKPKENIYLIGFDFGYNGQYVNHIYKDKEFHPKSTRPAQNENIFLKETLEIVRRYPLINFYWVNDNNFDIKINRITISQFKEIVYV